LVLLFGLLFPLGILISVYMGGEMNKMEFMLTLLAVVIIEIPIFIFFYYTKFEIIVLHEGFGYRWWPLQKKYRMIFKGEFLDIRSRNSPAHHYGIHWIRDFGWVHNVRAKRGFQIKLRSGKKIFIGSERVEEIKTVLEKVFNIRIGEFRNEF